MRLKKAVLPAVFALFLTVCLYYMQDGYFNTTEAKTIAFHFCCMAAAIPCVYAAAVSISAQGFTIAPAMIFAALFTLSYTIGAIGSSDAFFGSAGWNVGALSYILAFLLFVVFSTVPADHMVLSAVLAACTLPLYIIAVLDGAGADLFGLHGSLSPSESYDYISTVGNTTVYAGIVSLFIPVVCAALDFSDDVTPSAIRGLFATDIIAGFTSVCLCGSDSAYIGVSGALLVLFIIECKKGIPLWKIFRTLAFAGVSMCLPQLVWHLSPDAFPARRYISRMIFNTGAGFLLFPVALVAAFITSHPKKKSGYSPDWKIMAAIAAAFVTAAAVTASSSGISVSGRAKIWNYAINCFEKGDLKQKLTGVGADCFGYLTGAILRVETTPDGKSRVVSGYTGNDGSSVLSVDGREVVNCHNEFLQHLLCGGVITAVLWCLFVISVIVTALIRRPLSPFLFGFLGWLIQSMLNNPSNLLIPFVSILSALAVSRVDSYQ